MAGEWIKMRVDLREDPTVFRLAEMLGVDELHVIGILFCFWAWVDRHAVDGHVDGATSRLVDKVSMTPGFSEAMSAVGWLVVDERGVSIPKFERHNGESAKERSLKNARQARWRASKGADVDADVDASPSTDASTREEKRREERKKDPPTPRQRGEVVSEGFANFWNAYPPTVRKAAKAQCWEKWRRRGLEPKAAEIAAHVKAMTASEAWRKDGGSFIPAPLVYLNQARFEAPTESQVDAANWRETRSGVEAKGEALGLGRWDEYACSTGQGEPFKAYERRVIAAAECRA